MTDKSLTKSSLELPELAESVLDADQIAALFRDVEALTEIMEIIPKHGPRDYVDDTTELTLTSALDGLLDGTFRGVQIRYRYDGGWWWDTIINVPGGYRIVRIRHDPESGVASPNLVFVCKPDKGLDRLERLRAYARHLV